MSGEEGNSKPSKSKEKVCRVVIQQCTSADLRFDTDDTPRSIRNGMVLFTCFLQEASIEHLDSIVKGILNAKLCEAPNDAEDSALPSATGSTSRDSVVLRKLDILIIPQATLGGKLKGKGVQYHGLVSKSFGEELFGKFVEKIKDYLRDEGSHGKVECGVYGARQILKMETNGPFTHIFEF